jgi:hypothetical protein
MDEQAFHFHVTKLAELRIWRFEAAAWDEFSSVLDSAPAPEHVEQLAALFARSAEVHAAGID